MKTYLGMDFGGTKLLIGEMDGEGNALRSKRYGTGAQNQEQAVKILLNALEDYQKTVGFKGELAGAGLGIVGVVNHTEGLWVSINHNITAPPIPLALMISDKLKVPAAIDNDVRSTTTAELLWGHGKKSKNFIYLNVGTGLAAGFVIDGRILRGANNNSGEIGHMVTDIKSAQECICGRCGCAENVVSGVGFTRSAKELSASYKTALEIPAEGGVDVVELFRLADEGDPLCVKLTEQAAETLACVMMNLIRVSDPDMFIVGGGIVSDGWLMKKVQGGLLNPATIRGLHNGIVLSKFQPQNAGLAGAGAVAMVAAQQKLI